MNICKILLATIFIGFGLVNANAQTCATAPIGLVAAYSGDNSALDARSRSNGTLQNGVVYTAGNVGQAFLLGGNGNASNSGDRVIVGNPANLRLQSFTVEAWIRRSSTTILTNSPVAGVVNGTIFAFGASGWGIVIDQPTNRLAFTQVGINQINSNFTITDTNWHHVAVSISGTQAVFYLDGVADIPINYAVNFAYTTNAAIGARGDNDARNAFFGAVDELAIYNRVLSASEIQTIFNAGTIGKCKPLATFAPDNQVLWLAGDGDALDSSGNGNNGTLQSGASYTVGKVGQGIQFNGSGFVSVADAPSLNPTAQVTVEGWVYPTTDSIASAMSIILNKETNAAVQYEIARRLNSGACQSGGGIPTGNFAVYVGGLSGLPDDCGGWVNGNAPLPLNTWSHVAMTYDGSNLRAFVNGVNTRTVAATGAIPVTNGLLRLSKRVMNTAETWIGQMDEMSVYSRALTTAEIESIANAGLAGKYKAQSTVPNGLAAWFAGDGNANDLQAGNNGTIQNGVTFASGKVGQAFQLGGNGNASDSGDRVIVGNPPSLQLQSFTFETWVKRSSTTILTNSPVAGVVNGTIFAYGQNGWSVVIVQATNRLSFSQVGVNQINSNFTITDTNWHHVAVSISGSQAVFYLDGVADTPINYAATFAYTTNAAIGARGDSDARNAFFGAVDELSIYNRVLTAAEIRDQFYAGNGGKYKGAVNPTVSNTTKTGEATVTFGSVTNAGTVHLTPLDAAALPALPMGTNTGLNFDVSTSAAYTNPTVCFNVSSIPSAQFSNLRIYHLESGIWQNRTSGVNSYPNLCSSGLTSLSPFVIASVTPSAANVSISGRVTVGKSGLARAVVTLTDGSGETRSVRTGSFGNFRFDGLTAGATYVVSVNHKRYTFTPRIVSTLDDLTELDFTAEE